MNVANEVKAKVPLFVDGIFNNLRDNIKRPDIEIDENRETGSLSDLLTASNDERYIPMMKEYIMIVISLSVEVATEGFRSFKKLSKIIKLLSEKVDRPIVLITSPPATALSRMTQIAIFYKNLISLMSIGPRF